MSWRFEYTPVGNRRGGACGAREAIGSGRRRASLPRSRGARLLLRLPRSAPGGVVLRRGLRRPLLPVQRAPEHPPSLLATALLLQAYEGISDEEAKARADFDLGWKVALGVGLKERPFAKSTLQLFRARLLIHERVQTVLRKSLNFARHTGYLQSRRLKIVLDTTYVLGRGALKDTYNLLADGIIKLARELAAGASCSEQEGWAREHSLGRYFGSSVKGEAGIDWDDPEAREEFLRGVVADADSLLEMARAALAHIPSGDPA